MNTKLKQKAKSNFEKYFFKLIHTYLLVDSIAITGVGGDDNAKRYLDFSSKKNCIFKSI